MGWVFKPGLDLSQIVLIVALVGYHHYCLGIIKAFTRGEVRHSKNSFVSLMKFPCLSLSA